MQQQTMTTNQSAAGTMMGSTNMQHAMNHGGHEVLDVIEAISGTIGLIDNMVIYNDYIKDQELKTIANRQHQFVLDQYNILVEAFSTGKDPSHPTSQYKMQQDNNVIYGLQPSKPKKPIMSTAEITDECISSLLLDCVKSAASMYTKASLECTNPVVRRVLADSTPNLIEMAYEISLYQNKKGYYQVPQFAAQDMNQMLTSYTTVNKQQLQ
jgi:spore coat protein CotF